MANNTHSALTGAELHVPGYVQASDPGAVGAGKLWIDTALGTGKWAIKLRKADNSGWEQDSSADLNGGTIDATVIGGATPAAGTFTTLETTGAFTMPNNVPYQAKSSGGVATQVFKLGGTDILVFGTTSTVAAIWFFPGSAAAQLKVTPTETNIVGDLNHDGANVGFYSVTPAARPSAYTQTYATATKTHSAPTATALTAASGTADGTVADVGAAFNQTTLNNNFKDLATAINALIVDVANVKQVLNSVIDDGQITGLLQ